MLKLNRYPFEIKDKVFKKLIETCDVASWSREERLSLCSYSTGFKDTLLSLRNSASSIDKAEFCLHTFTMPQVIPV